MTINWEVIIWTCITLAVLMSVIGVILYLVSAVQRNKTTKEERRAAMFSHANANTEA